MKMIQGWYDKNLKCTRCDIEKSVKYEHETKPYCNKCIQVVKSLKNTGSC